jgi:hypothetical protein
MAVEPGPQLDSLRGLLAEAISFWEPRRLLYNLLLSAIVIIWVAGTWPHFRAMPQRSSFLLLVVLALLANVCYSAAYLVDIPLEHSPIQAIWRRRRWLLWLLGTVFAMALENYWIADEIYPYVHR